MGLRNGISARSALIAFLILNSWSSQAAVTDPLSPQELVTRCFESLGNMRLSFLDTRRASVNNQATALALCDKLIDAPKLDLSQGSIVTGNPTIKITEAKEVVRRFQQFHESQFKSDKYEAVFTEFGMTKQLFDTANPAAYFTLSVFSPVPDYGLAVTETSILKILRGNASASAYGNVRQSSTQQNATRIDDSTVVASADRGLFSGLVRVNSVLGEVKNGTLPGIDAEREYLYKKTLGGGYLGDPTFLLLNSGLAINKTSNGSMILPRRWSREVMSTALCRNGPYVKSGASVLTSDRASPANSTSAPGFRNATQCLQCHSTMDPMAMAIRNYSANEHNLTLPTPAPAGFDQGGDLRIFLARPARFTGVPATNINTWNWPQAASGIANFHKQKNAPGRFTFTSAMDPNAGLVNNYFTADITMGSSQLTPLGNQFKNSPDYYLCGVKRYFELLSGVHFEIDTESLPDLPQGASGYERQLFSDFRAQAQLFMVDRNTKEMLKRLIRSDAFLSRSWGRKSMNGTVRVTSIAPSSGPYLGGTSVVITGANFGNDSIAKVGGVICSITSKTSTEIHCTTGYHLSGAVGVEVTSGGNVDAIAGIYTYFGLPTYTSIKANIIVPRCLSCHDSGASGGLNMSTYASALATNPDSGVKDVVPGNANSSPLYLRASAATMPPSAGANPSSSAAVPPADLILIRDWINAGALNN